jgi:hypothetical protein
MQWPLEKIKDAAAAMQSVAIAIAVFIGGFWRRIGQFFEAAA